MNTSKPEYLNCSAEVVGGLIETVCAALMDNFPHSQVDCNDAAMVLDALHVLRPDAPELDALDGIHCIVQGSYADAIRILRQLTETAPNFAYARALLSFSLAAIGDPQWRQQAGEVMDEPQSHNAQQLVRLLIARHDLMAARRASKLGGEFVMPESVKSLLDSASASAPASAPAPHEHASSADQQAGFLRA